MKRKRYIAYFLIVVSLIMLTAAVMPHHHHQEVLCLQSDVTECGCACSCTTEQHSHEMPDHTHSCGAGCVTDFCSLMPDEAFGFISPDYAFCSLLYTAVDVLVLSLRLFEDVSVSFSPYVEQLHSTCLPCVAGLRAPPCLLA